jgi:hypothetical protein
VITLSRSQAAIADPTAGSSHSSGADIFDGGIDRLAIVDELNARCHDPFSQPDGLVPAGTDNSIFTTGHASRQSP